MTETDIYQKYLKKYNYIVEFTKIESGSTKCGIPDIYYLSNINNSHGWLELKIGYLSKGVIKIDYRPGQQNWLAKHLDKGLNSFTLIFYDTLFYLTRYFIDSFESKQHLTSHSLWVGYKLNQEFIKRILL